MQSTWWNPNSCRWGIEPFNLQLFPNTNFFFLGSEDCLYIYVYVPKENINKEDNFDVVVHIHGGYLNIGSPYNMVLPDYIMDKNVILVSFNYRLGAAGKATIESYEKAL